MTLKHSLLFFISEKGQVITATYTQPLWSTFNRREHLKMSKCFWCACPRCADPTEFGSYLSALNCQLCGGRILSTNPLDQKAKWKWVKNEKRKISSDGRRCFFCRLGSDPDLRTQLNRHLSDPNGKKRKSYYLITDVTSAKRASMAMRSSLSTIRWLQSSSPPTDQIRTPLTHSSKITQQRFQTGKKTKITFDVLLLMSLVIYEMALLFHISILYLRLMKAIFLFFHQPPNDPWGSIRTALPFQVRWPWADERQHVVEEIHVLQTGLPSHTFFFGLPVFSL